MTGVDGKSFIVTGGGSGIGAATVIRLLRAGAKVTAAGTNEEGLARTRLAAGETDSLSTVRFNLEDEASIVDLVAGAVRDFGRLDGVANVAASLKPEIMHKDGGVADMDPEIWSRIFRINLIGTGLVIRESLPHLVTAGGGSIVNISSAAAWMGEIERTAYAASKIGLHALTRHTARAWGSANIRCNVVAPGKVLSETGLTLLPKAQHEAILARICLPRLGKPEDLAAMITFLLSDDGSWITGQNISVDGGLLLRE